MYFIYLIFFLLTILLSVAFFTLFERKVLGYVHRRLGPNKNALSGKGQPFNDLIKLFSRIEYIFSLTKIFFFFISPIFIVVISIIIWVMFSHEGSGISMKYFLAMLIVSNGILTFFFLYPGWSRGSFYRMIGGYRSSAQCISYEGIFFFILLSLVFILFSFNFTEIGYFITITSIIFVLYPLIFCWFLVVLAETNRTPFDFAEGERELVSGFNTEYGRGFFSIIFLREYIRILFYSFITSYFFFSIRTEHLIGIAFCATIFIWVRLAYPRFRYDKLIVLSWKSLILITVSLLVLICFLVLF